MKTAKYILFTLFLCLAASGQTLQARKLVFKMADYGIRPNTEADHTLSSRLDIAFDCIRRKVSPQDKIVMRFEPGTYHFHADRAREHELYISNHDQDQPKRVGVFVEGWNNLTIDGKKADFVCHGRMIPLVISRTTHFRLDNLSIDFAN